MAYRLGVAGAISLHEGGSKMRRKLAGALALVLGLSLSGSAMAQEMSGTHGVVIPLKFRVSLAAVLNGYIDSTFSTNATAWPTATGAIDTTTGFSTVGLVPMPGVASAAPNDTIATLRVIFVDAGSTGLAAGDSLYVIPQVSGDGSSWAYVNLVKDALASGAPVAAATILTEAIPLRLQADKSGTILFHQALSGRWSADVNQLLSWPYIRFLLVHDVSSGAVLANYRCYVYGWSASATRNN